MWLKRLFAKQLSMPKKVESRIAKVPRTFSLEAVLEAIRPLPGEWESLMRGKGYSLSRFKEFCPPDNPSLIHIPTLARIGEEYIAERIPHRGAEVTVLFDVSASCDQGIAGEIRDAATFVLAAGAVEKESPLSFAGFGDQLECVFPLDEPRIQFQRFRKWLVESELRRQGSPKKTSFRPLIPYVSVKVPERSLVFLVSDFLGQEGLTELMSILRRGIDCTPVVVDSSQIWEKLPLGFYEIDAADSEEGGYEILSLSPHKIQEIRALHRKRQEEVASFFRSNGLHHAVVQSSDLRVCMSVFTKCFRQKIRHRK